MIDVMTLGQDDWRLWRELRLAALAEAPYAFGSTLAEWQGDGDREERWRARLALADSHNAVARVDGRPAGMVSGVPTGSADVVDLISLWVSPTARRLGVGGVLIDEVARWAARRRATAVRLSVAPDNAAAVALYESLGFRDTGVPGEPLRDGAGTEVVMERSLYGGPR
ncbi:N-acetyltransferase [Streptomyces sp. TS71-3]|uniref:GNAT family N-acetyltransferase n=1 Tax=Streptomyces sp. TS71-3 TaxID=2733862 RepID=UPI001BB3EE0F|nr:GNAT family N-acetyltransferase [Streptomyces sp. TS71-3]